MNLTPLSPVLEARLTAASRVLNADGWGPESMDLYCRFRSEPWRLLTEYLELMAVAGYPESLIDSIRDLPAPPTA